jgi:predicted acylesterase/phospholipase RssA
MRKGHRVYRLLHNHAEEWLNRMGVGDQILGAEPLALLIIEHVLRPAGLLQMPDGELPSDQVPFDAFIDQGGIYLLATTTNLTLGRLEILGEQQFAGPTSRAMLLDGLLASSAFPGVFRPRWSWEVMPMTRHRHQYTDGGVMDNLPLDAVAQFLNTVAGTDLIPARPQFEGMPVPHMLFSASLQERPPDPSAADLERYTRSWPEILERARKLGYNKKLELFQTTQRALRALWKDYGNVGTWEPLDLEVVMVRPAWLCGTFAFHPMLGFRRSRQAESIAHGCAGTLQELAQVQATQPDWTRAWGVNLDQPAGARPAADPCWLRPGITCPFSQTGLAAAALPGDTVDQLARIYHACLRNERSRTVEV